MPEDLEKQENQFQDFETPEVAPEEAIEKKETRPELETKPEGFKIGEKDEEQAERTGVEAKIPLSASAAPYKSPTLMQIEDILEEDLKNSYFGMSAEKKKEFKQKGEETASRIEKMVESVKINSNKILGLIKKWLKLIPGINKFFLEQEAKIKTDKILNLRERK